MLFLMFPRLFIRIYDIIVIDTVYKVHGVLK